MSRFRRFGAVTLVLMPVFALSGCGTLMVTSAVVGTTVAVGSVAADVAVGAGVLAVQGTGAVIGGAGRLAGAAIARPEAERDCPDRSETTSEPVRAPARHPSCENPRP